MKCEICGENKKRIQEFSKHLKKIHNINNVKEYYDKYLKKEGEGICSMYGQIPSCNKYTNFTNFKEGYNKYCSVKCANSSNEKKNKIIKTCLKKYGVKYVSQSKNIKEKIKQTNLKRYGVEWTSQNKEIKEKQKQINLERYGVENPIQNKKIKRKIKQNNIKKFIPLLNKQLEYLNLELLDEKYIGAHYKHNWKCLKCESKFQQQWNRLKLFYKCPMCYPRNKRKPKNFNKQLNKLNIKLLENYINSKYRHNWKCLKCNNEFIKSWNNVQKKDYGCKICYPVEKRKPNDFKNKLKYLNIELLDNKYINENYYHLWKCTICETKFNQLWRYIIHDDYKCPKCYPRNQGYSKGEKELVEFIRILDLDIIENSRKIISPKELDIYIPSKNVAIEFNGLYWHSEEYIKDKFYHLNKIEECLKNNIRLIHIFEDEWIFKQEIVKSRLKQILNMSNSIRIHARKCIIKEISPKIKNEFLDLYHIQGRDKSNIKLGSFYNDELVSVMTFSKGSIAKGSKNIENVWELNRFCSNSKYNIPGIASKLLTYFKKNYEWKEIFSYADRRWSDGNVYKQIGFKLNSITKPNYWYIKNGLRIHRFNLRKRPDEPKDIPEWVLRTKEGYHRIWDCGHYKFKIRRI